MKKHNGSKTYVMLGLLAVLLVSLGYLSVQKVNEGMETKKYNRELDNRKIGQNKQ
jgi:hypothetical protein